MVSVRAASDVFQSRRAPILLGAVLQLLGKALTFLNPTVGLLAGARLLDRCALFHARAIYDVVPASMITMCLVSSFDNPPMPVQFVKAIVYR